VVGLAVPQVGHCHSAAGTGSAVLVSASSAAGGTGFDGTGTSAATVGFHMVESRKGGLGLM
jgi:hypothetical protein